MDKNEIEKNGCLRWPYIIVVFISGIYISSINDRHGWSVELEKIFDCQYIIIRDASGDLLRGKVHFRPLYSLNDRANATVGFFF